MVKTPVRAWNMLLAALLALRLTGCDAPPGQATTGAGDPNTTMNTHTDTTAGPPAEKQTELMKRFVAAPSGLRLRKSPHADAEILKHMAFGTAVLLDGAKDTARLAVSNIPGHWVRAVHETDTGWAFSGWLSTLPLPPLHGPDHQWDRIRDYADSLQAGGYAARIDRWREATPDGHRTVLTLPLADVYDAYHVMRHLFYIPLSYRFPAGDEVVLSTPGDPSEAARESPYDYVTHSWKLTRDEAGTIATLTYRDDNEVGGRSITAAPAEGGFQLTLDTWTH